MEKNVLPNLWLKIWILKNNQNIKILKVFRLESEKLKFWSYEIGWKVAVFRLMTIYSFNKLNHSCTWSNFKILNRIVAIKIRLHYVIGIGRNSYFWPVVRKLYLLLELLFYRTFRPKKDRLWPGCDTWKYFIWTIF